MADATALPAAGEAVAAGTFRSTSLCIRGKSVKELLTRQAHDLRFQPRTPGAPICLVMPLLLKHFHRSRCRLITPYLCKKAVVSAVALRLLRVQQVHRSLEFLVNGFVVQTKTPKQKLAKLQNCEEIAKTRSSSFVDAFQLREAALLRSSAAPTRWLPLKPGCM